MDTWLAVSSAQICEMPPGHRISTVHGAEIANLCPACACLWNLPGHWLGKPGFYQDATGRVAMSSSARAFAWNSFTGPMWTGQSRPVHGPSSVGCVFMSSTDAKHHEGLVQGLGTCIALSRHGSFLGCSKASQLQDVDETSVQVNSMAAFPIVSISCRPCWVNVVAGKATNFIAGST